MVRRQPQRVSTRRRARMEAERERKLREQVKELKRQVKEMEKSMQIIMTSPQRTMLYALHGVPLEETGEVLTNEGVGVGYLEILKRIEEEKKGVRPSSEEETEF